MAVLANAHPTSSCSAPASQGITSFACRAFFLLCNLSLSDVIWSLLSNGEQFLLFLLLQLCHMGRWSLFILPKPKQSNSFVPSLYFWLCSMTLTPSLDCLAISQGLNSLAEVLGSPCQHICHPLFSSGGLLWIHPSQLHCRSLRYWRAP